MLLKLNRPIAIKKIQKLYKFNNDSVKIITKSLKSVLKNKLTSYEEKFIKNY
jgi:hypothetical protein